MTTPHLETLDASQPHLATASAETTEAAWRPLYRVGGAAALIIVVLYVIQIIVFVASPPPGTVIGYFTLFYKNTLLGLLDLDLLSLADYALFVPMFLALYMALRRANPSFMAIATVLAFVGIATYFASNTAFEMLSLSNQYAAATNEAQKSLIEASGQGMLAIYQGTAFDVSYVLLSLAPLMVSVVMLRSKVFGKATASVGILANAVALGGFVPTIGIFLALLSIVGLLIWNILLARRLFQLARGVSNQEAKRKHPSHQPVGFRLHRLLNPVMRVLLHSPLHGVQSHSVLLLTYTGKKSGQRRTIPVGYVEEGETLYILVGHAEQKTWWRNLRGGAPVQLWLRGHEVSGYAEVVSGQCEAVVRGLTAYLQRFPHSATIRGMRRGSDGRFAPDEIERAAVDTVMVRITPAASVAARVQTLS